MRIWCIFFVLISFWTVAVPQDLTTSEPKTSKSNTTCAAQLIIYEDLIAELQTQLAAQAKDK